jgi:hypothetical protein
MAESHAAVSIIRGAKPSSQRRQTRLTFGRKIGNSIAASAQTETRPKGQVSFQFKVPCAKLPLRRFAVLCVLKNGTRAGGKSRGRDESESESSNCHKLLHSTSPMLIYTVLRCRADGPLRFTWNDTENLQAYWRSMTQPKFEITSLMSTL